MMMSHRLPAATELNMEEVAPGIRIGSDTDSCHYRQKMFVWSNFVVFQTWIGRLLSEEQYAFYKAGI